MKKLTIFYDNHCPNCTKFSYWVQRFDWCNWIIIKELRNPKNNDLKINQKLAEKQMASFDGKWAYGYLSLYKIFLRIPILWIFIPLFFILLISGLGQYIYQQFAVNRKIIPIHCEDSCKIDKY